MSQLGPQRIQTASDARSRQHARPATTSHGDSPTVGRENHASKLPLPLSGLTPQTLRPARSPRPAASSPLATSTTQNPSSSLQIQQGGDEPISNEKRRKEKRSPRINAAETTFYSDSSEPSSPDEDIPSFNFVNVTKDTQSASDTLNTTSFTGSKQPPPAAIMKSVSAAATSLQNQSVPRDSPSDNALLAPTKSDLAPSLQGRSKHGPDITGLIKAAGSPESALEHLLKEKHSQAQQNNQLWRLVDKQRAMILGLNKDLEAALKDKEKYRKKLKEFMADPAVLKAAGATISKGSATGSKPLAHVDVEETLSILHDDSGAESPVPESDSSKGSPTHLSLAPYPITPPADQPPRSPSALEAKLRPHYSAMSRSQADAVDEQNTSRHKSVTNKTKNDTVIERTQETLQSTSLTSPRTLPSEPPKMPPPELPPVLPPSRVTPEAASEPSQNVATFPAPPRKAPPAPLLLKQDISRRVAASSADSDSDSDYDDLLKVNEVPHAERGRRRTREADDREREILAFQEAEARSASKKSKASKRESPSGGSGTGATLASNKTQQELPSVSLNAVLHGDERSALAPAIMSPGLPSSPRPFPNPSASSQAPLSPRMAAVSGTQPLSPRPPRQAIPLPPNASLVTPSTFTENDPSVKPLNVVKSSHKAPQPDLESLDDKQSLVERTIIFKGFLNDEYPDLLLPPNALPTIDIKVASSRMKPSRASLLSLTQLEEDPVFTLAITSRNDGGELWRVEKDTTSFGKLDQRLKQCTAFTAKTPDRSLFNGHSPAKLDTRRIALEQYMTEVLATQFDVATALELCKYLSTNTLPPNADETGAPLSNLPDNNTQTLAPDGKPTRSGYLTKRGKNFGGWKMRFFVLDGPYLKYYETPGGPHLGTIKLQNAQIGRQSQRDNYSPTRNNADETDSEYRHAFLIGEPKKKDSSTLVRHVLCAENDKERDMWIDALLYWIEAREGDDGDFKVPKQPTHERVTTERLEQGGKLKKANPARGLQQPPEAEPDTLIGVRYDSTHAGEAPQVVATRLNKPSTLAADHSATSLASADTSALQPKVISGPKDMQLISDATAWGNKPGLAVPASDEKKQKKRSFFGFGSRARNSSDGQDSLFGGSESGSVVGSHNLHQGPVGQVFGSPLADAARYNPPVDVNVPLPCVVYRCIQYLEAKGAIQEEGIFRLSGSNIVIKQLRERFNTEGDINLITDDQYYDIHAVASLLKLYLRELPTTILTRELHMEFLATLEVPEKADKIRAMSELAQRLPQANAVLLKYLISFLIKIINQSDVNKMTVRNVGIVFSPTLNIPAPVFATFLQNFEAIFGIDPEEYELPPTLPEAESHTQVEPQQQFEYPARPSTSSGGSESPHRQPKLEPVRDYARSTPTPPLAIINPAQGSPTPPTGATRAVYEPVSTAPQGSVKLSASTHPGHDISHSKSSPADGRDVHSTPRRVLGDEQQTYEPSNDEQALDQLPVFDQSFKMGSKRRESSIYFGANNAAIQQQGSKSRFREEARY